MRPGFGLWTGHRTKTLTSRDTYTRYGRTKDPQYPPLNLSSSREGRVENGILKKYCSKEERPTIKRVDTLHSLIEVLDRLNFIFTFVLWSLRLRKPGKGSYQLLEGLVCEMEVRVRDSSHLVRTLRISPCFRVSVSAPLVRHIFSPSMVSVSAPRVRHIFWPSMEVLGVDPESRCRPQTTCEAEREV